MDLHEQKAALRKQMAETIRALPPAERATQDRALVDNVFESLGRYFHIDSVLLAYVPLRDEVDIGPVLAESVELDLCLALPRLGPEDLLVLHRVTDFERDLEKSGYGVLEPKGTLPLVPFPRVDLALIPGRAFSPAGDRLGRGSAHYDRALNTLIGLTVGIAYDCQVVDHVPTNEHDRPVDVVLTPTRVIETHRRERL